MLGGDLKQAANAGINSFNASNINIIMKGTRTQLFDVPYIDKVNKLDISQSADVKIKQNMDGSTLEGIEKITAPEGFTSYR